MYSCTYAYTYILSVYIYISMHNINIYSNMYTHTVIRFLHHSTLRGPNFRLEEGDFAVFFSGNRCVAGYYKVGLKR